MRLILTAAALLLAVGTAFALPGDDYAVCLIGQSVISLHNPPDDAVAPLSSSLNVAHSLCPVPATLAAKTVLEIDEYVETIVEDVAGGLNLLRSSEANQ